MIKKILAVGLLVLAGALSPAFCAPWERLCGQHSGIAEFRAVVIDNLEDWKRLWTEHQGSLQGLPEVDFSKERVAGVFFGLRTSGGHTAALDVQTGPEGVTVVYDLRSPKGFAAMVMTTPFAFVKLPPVPIRVVPAGRTPRSAQAAGRKLDIQDAAGRVSGLLNRIEAARGLFD